MTNTIGEINFWEVVILAILILICGLFGSVAYPQASAPHEINVIEAMGLAEKADPSLGAARAVTTQFQYSIDVAKAGYYPRLDLEATDSTGFPGSSSLTGIGGLMGSPYRSGYSYGAVASMTVWDFGRTGYGVEIAKNEFQGSQEDLKLRREEVYRNVLGAFFNCVSTRSQETMYQKMSEEANRVTKEVNRFVRTGQRSIVDKYLSESQAEEIHTSQSTYQEKFEISRRRLALLIGREGQAVLCPELSAVPERSLESLNRDEKNPLLARAEAAAEAARNAANQIHADYYPKITAVGSVGQMDDARLVSQQYYAAGAGLIIPVFEGFRIKSEESQANAKVLEADYTVSFVRQTISDIDARYDEIIRADAVEREHLVHELELGHQAFEVAGKRYFTLQGGLIDLRDSMSNLLRVETRSIDVGAELLLNEGLKAVSDGGHL